MAKLAAIALLFLVGVLLRRFGGIDASHGARLLRVVATVGLPALIIGAVGRVPLQPSLLALPASAVAVMLVSSMHSGCRAWTERWQLQAAGQLVTLLVVPAPRSSSWAARPRSDSAPW